MNSLFSTEPIVLNLPDADIIYDPSFWKRRHFIFFDYACKTDSLSVQLNDEAEEHVWVSPEAALHLPLDSYTRTSVERIIAGNLS